MILSALYDRYLRKAAAGDVPEFGFNRERVSAALLLRPGRPPRLLDLREGVKTAPRAMPVPHPGGSRTSGVRAYFLWDKTAYLLGADATAKSDLVARQHAESRRLHQELLAGCDDDGARAVLAFFDMWRPSNVADLGESWPGMSGANLVFQVDGDHGRYIHERPLLRQRWLAHLGAREGAAEAFCLVSGETGPVEKVHLPLKGVDGAQTSGAALVSFNSGAWCSYGRGTDDQSLNAPVSQAVAFGYATALNDLLRRDSGQRLRIADTTIVLWAERPDTSESLMASLFAPPVGRMTADEEPGKADDPSSARRVMRVLERLRDGCPSRDLMQGLDPSVRYFILALAAPGRSRLAVRLWEVCRLGDLLENVGRHYEDLRIEKQWPHDPDFPPLWLLVRECAVGREARNDPPSLGAALTRAALLGGSYPDALPALVVGRIRADHEINTLRAAMLKAWLRRNRRTEVDVSLNEDEPNTAYRLGRLFAALERAQQLALPNVNTGIRERCYGAASAAPRAMFPQLLRMAQHHLAKAEHSGWLDKVIGRVVDDLNTEFPSHLTLEDQGRFALGYYHQRNAFWKKKPEAQVP
ncbi:MAG: type I-C CRISPR-associated protein Cas8c/Csd1 [Alphaproteobacteria bacterium]|nr:type I-C CRISPR-associated protein Cas8c/Csd1 [Alphaproteobacteria bacterium]